MTIKKAGLWLANGTPTNPEQMYSWKPGTITCIYDYLSANKVAEYIQGNREAKLIVRFMHPKNWLDEITVSATNFGREVAGKWQSDPTLRDITHLIYAGNEMNLWVECNGRPQDQPLYENEQHYENLGQWFRTFCEVAKNEAPDMPLAMPPLAYGHKEDGEPDDNGNPKIGWAGYDYLQETTKLYCAGNMAAHYYWGDGTNSRREWLYDEAQNTWHAFRFERVLKLFATRYGWTPTIWIDECGNFSPQDDDFTEQCLYFSKRALANRFVGGLTFFLWEDPHGSNNINSWVANITNLDQHLRDMGALTVNDGGNQGVKPMSVFLTFEESKGVLADNLRAHETDSSGKVIGSVARIVPVDTVQSHLDPNNMPKQGDYYWKVIRASLIDEEHARGETEIVVNYIDENGIPMGGAQAWFMYPTDRLTDSGIWIGKFDNGGGNGDVFVTDNGTTGIAQGKNDFNPPIGSENIGPYIVGYAGEYTELIAGFGLTYNRHLKYTVTFKRVKYQDNAPVEPPVNPPQEPDECSSAFANKLIRIIKAIFC